MAYHSIRICGLCLMGWKHEVCVEGTLWVFPRRDVGRSFAGECPDGLAHRLARCDLGRWPRGHRSIRG